LYYFIFLYCDLTYKEPTRKYKKPFSKGQRAWNVKLPLLDAFRTFKGNITTENVILNQLILQY